MTLRIFDFDNAQIFPESWIKLFYINYKKPDRCDGYVRSFIMNISEICTVQHYNCQFIWVAIYIKYLLLTNDKHTVILAETLITKLSEYLINPKAKWLFLELQSLVTEYHEKF